MAERKPRRRRRQNGFIEIANALLALLVLGILAVGGVLFFGMQQFYAPGPVAEDTTFVVERNSGLSTVATRLEDKGLIGNRFIFQAGSYALKKQGELKAGEFRIPAGASMADILREFTEGRAIQHAVTVPEGYTVWQALARIEEAPMLTGEIPEPHPPEGSILPQTYNFDRGATRASILERMQEEMKKEVDRVWASCNPEVCGPDKPIKTKEDLVILASVVEKETGVASERPQVAAVFINRLKRGMRLQSDPTIIYGINMGQGPLGRDIRRSEIDTANDYNTYQMDGLPKGPIANPGVEALEAVANPADTPALYFVAAGATPSEGHLFANTYAEHQQNVAKYRQIVREHQQNLEAQAAREALAAEEAAEAGDAAAPAEQPPAQ